MLGNLLLRRMAKTMKVVESKKAAMKKVVKGQSLKKAASKSAAKSAAMKKTGKKNASEASSLGKESLKQLGCLSLQERVDRIAEVAETPDAAAMRLRDTLTKADKSNVWSQHQNYLKSRPDEKEEYEQMNNLEKGRAQSLWFVKKSSPKFINFEMTVGGGDRVEKGDTWKSEKQMLDTFGPQELERHIASGRVLWREDPLTKDIWQYKDQGDIVRTICVNRHKTVKKQQEYAADEGLEGQFHQMWDADIMGMLGDASIWAGDDLGKGKGGGKSLAILEKGKSKGKGKNVPPATEAVPKSEEALLEDAQSKCRKMRDLCAKTAADLEISISQVRKTKFWSKHAQKDADTLTKDLHEQCGLLKTVLLKKSDNFDKLKEVCLGAAEKVKFAIGQMKEFKSLVNKTTSKASSRR